MDSNVDKLNLEELSILKEKYSLHKQEAFIFVKLSKSHIHYLQLFFGALIAGSAIIIDHENLYLKKDTWMFWWICPILVVILANYLATDIADDFYHLILLGQRMIMIEKRINNILGRSILIWESKVIPKFFEESKPVKEIYNPNWILGFFFGIIFLGCLIIPGVIYYNIWEADFSKKAIIIRPLLIMFYFFILILTLFTFINFIRILLKMRKNVKDFFENL